MSKNGQFFNGYNISIFISHQTEKWGTEKLIYPQFINPYFNWQLSQVKLVQVKQLEWKYFATKKSICTLNNYNLHINWQVHLISSSAELNLIQVLPSSIFERFDLPPEFIFWKNPCQNHVISGSHVRSRDPDCPSTRQAKNCLGVAQ